MSLHPTAGVRILLERAGHPSSEPAAASAADDGGATAEAAPGPVRYRGAILTPDARFDYEVVFAGDGAPSLAPRPGSGAPPPRAAELLAAIARTVGRHAVSESPPSWPRRVLRWRKAA